MKSKAEHLEKQLAELRKNLLLIELRKTEFVQQTEIPLQLIKDEHDTRETIDHLERQLKELSELKPWTPQPVPKRELGSKTIVAAVLGSAVAIAVMVLGALRLFPPSSRGEPSQQSTVNVTASTVTPSAVSALPIPTLAPAVTPVAVVTETLVPLITPTETPAESVAATVGPGAQLPPSLPATAPALTTRVVLVGEPACQDDQKKLIDFIADQTKGVAPPVEVRLGAMTTATGTIMTQETARASGSQQAADLFIWCANAAEGITFQFELIAQRTPTEVYDPPTMSVSVTSEGQLQRLALGLVHYLRRDYEAAASLLKTAIDKTDSRDESQRILMKLLIGNSTLFRRQYAEAAKQFEAIVASEPMLAFAWNNLGVARMNAGWGGVDPKRYESAVEALQKALLIGDTSGLPLITLARIYKLTIPEVAGSYEKASGYCTEMKNAQDERVRAQSDVCILFLDFVAVGEGVIDRLPKADSAALQLTTTSSWAEPLAVIGLLEYSYWDRNKDKVAKDNAQKYLTLYIQMANDDLLLGESVTLYTMCISDYLPEVGGYSP